MDSKKLNDVPEVEHPMPMAFTFMASSFDPRGNVVDMNRFLNNVDVDAYIKEMSDDEEYDISYYLNSESDETTGKWRKCTNGTKRGKGP